MLFRKKNGTLNRSQREKLKKNGIITSLSREGLNMIYVLLVEGVKGDNALFEEENRRRQSNQPWHIEHKTKN